MQLAKCFVVLLVLIARICGSEPKIEVKNPDSSTELQEAAIKILKTCYASRDTTVVLMGDHPGNFIERLSAQRKFALILTHDSMRVNTITRFVIHSEDEKRRHRVRVVVATATSVKRMAKLLSSYVFTPYHDATSRLLVLGWSPQNKHAICDGRTRTLDFLSGFNPHTLLNVKVMCHHREKHIMIYDTNCFTNQIPEPWKWTGFARRTNIWLNYRLLEQIYREHMGMCNNLDIDKTRDLGGTPIEMVMPMADSRYFIAVSKSNDTLLRRRYRILSERGHQPFRMFLHYVNATEIIVNVRVVVGANPSTKNLYSIDKRLTPLPGIEILRRPYAYPLRTECAFLVTQFRGNKSQLQKIFDVIDIYSWVGMYMVYLVTLIFFKYFLRQSVIEGILNLVRLTSNVGLIILPPNVAPRIYLSCLLFFVVTMQGIFLGNLAALLTHDIPIRQVESIQDLIDFGYTIYVGEADLTRFDHPAFKGRVRIFETDENCMPFVKRDPLIACLIYGDARKNDALALNLHVSSTCLFSYYVTYTIPFFWTLENTWNKLMAITFAADILTPFDVMVDEKRLIEYQSQKVEPEPRVMTLTNLDFAFTILGIGLSFALVTFIAELIYYRFKNRVKTTRVIVLN